MISAQPPDILKDFAREVLRNQPANINEFAAKYFDCLAQGLPAEGTAGDAAAGAFFAAAFAEGFGNIFGVFDLHERRASP